MRLPAEGERLVLDSGQGTRLMACGLDLGTTDPSLWVLDRPEAVVQLHRDDVAAGADVVLTCTFGANAPTLGRFGRAADVGRVNRVAVGLARASGARYVFGSVGPSAGETLCDLQLETLAQAGVDALLLETFQGMRASNALEQAIDRMGAIPVIVSLWDWTGVEPRQLLDLGASAVGINCVSLQTASETLQQWAQDPTIPWLLKPNAGRPGESQASPEAFEHFARQLGALAVRYVGGCCGTTSEHTAALRRGLGTPV